MKTACFHTAGMHPNAIAICRYMPRWMHFSGHKYFALAPTPRMFQVNVEAFDVAYREQLERLDPRQVYIDLVALGGIDALLLCHEKPGIPCHRLAVARWLEAALGIEVPELEAPIVARRSTSTRSAKPSLADPEAVEFYLRRQLKLDL